MNKSIQCNICGSNTVYFSSAVILSKYKISYFQCSECGFVQTEKPYWLNEAYAEAISRYDIGSVNRAIVNADLCERYILQFFDCNAKFVDYGGGYGIMTRRMRDRGFDFYWSDKYCENLFAKKFEADLSGSISYELLTAFEVFEHLENPHQELETMLSIADNLLFSTYLLPVTNPKPGEWWYYSPLHGQHISIYTRKSLQKLADAHGLFLTSHRSKIHLLTKKPLLRLPLRDRVVKRLLGNVYFLRTKLNKQSLLEDDAFELSGVRFE